MKGVMELVAVCLCRWSRKKCNPAAGSVRNRTIKAGPRRHSVKNWPTVGASAYFGRRQRLPKGVIWRLIFGTLHSKTDSYLHVLSRWVDLSGKKAVQSR